MTPRQFILAGALAIAGWLALFGDKTPAGDIAEPVTHVEGHPPATQTMRQAAPVAHAATSKASSAPEILALRKREELVGDRHADMATNTLFASQNWNPPPPPPAKPAPPPPPIAPPLPFTYLGKKSEDGAWEVYLARGDQTLILREMGVIDRTYRVDTIHPPIMSITYLPLNQGQTLAIGGAE